MEETVIRLKDRRLVLLNVQEWVGQGAAALALLSTGMARLRHASGALSWLPVADVAVAAVLLAAIVREVKATRGARGHPHDAAHRGGPGWVSLLGGVACFLDWGAHLSTGGKALSPTLLTGIVNVWQGLMQPRLERRRHERRFVRLDGVGIDARLSRVRHFQAPWSGIASITRDGGRLLITARDGRACKVTARRYENFGEVADAVVGHASAHGVRVLGTESTSTAAAGAPRETSSP
jgi:hypothetical protein